VGLAAKAYYHNRVGQNWSLLGGTAILQSSIGHRYKWKTSREKNQILASSDEK